MPVIEKKINQYILRYESKNKVIVFASIMAAILVTSLVTVNLSIVGNAEALIEPHEVFCLNYPEFCVVDENITNLVLQHVQQVQT